MGIDLVLSRLAGVRKTGSGTWVAKCPSHQDRTPSLSLRQADDRVLLHCFAGCGTDDILAALGLTFADVMPERVAHHRPRMKPAFPYADVLQILGYDVMQTAIAASEMAAGRELSPADRVTLVISADRCAKALEYIRGR